MEKTGQKKEAVCLWMQTGVVARKICFQEFQCTSCRFDQALRAVCRENRKKRNQGVRVSGKKGALVFWEDRMRQKPLGRRPCVHHMKGWINFRVCHRDYQCTTCEFDHYFQDQFAVHAVVKPAKEVKIDGVRLPAGYYLHPGHTWVKIEEGREVRIGLDDFVGRLFGPLDQILSPLVGKQVTRGKGEILGIRDGREVIFVSPVSGIITAVNTRLRKDGGSAARSPYTEGWVMRVHTVDLKTDLRHLLFMDETRSFMEDEIRSLFILLEKKGYLEAADGGGMGPDIFGHAPGISWDGLAARFTAPDS